MKPAAFKWRHFHDEVIHQYVRWDCKYGISYRDLEEMMAERGLEIDHVNDYSSRQRLQEWETQGRSR